MKNYICILICLKIYLVKKNCRKTLFPKGLCSRVLSQSTVVRQLASFGTWRVFDHLRVVEHLAEFATWLVMISTLRDISICQMSTWREMSTWQTFTLGENVFHANYDGPVIPYIQNYQTKTKLVRNKVSYFILNY